MVLLTLFVLLALGAAWLSFNWRAVRRDGVAALVGESGDGIRTGQAPGTAQKVTGGASPRGQSTTDQQAGALADRTADEGEPPDTDGTIYVDLLVKAPTAPRATGWFPEYTDHIIFGGCSVNRQYQELLPEPVAERGFFRYPRALRVKPGSGRVCIALFMTLRPVDTDGNVIAGYLTCFAGHLAIPSEELHSVRRLTLEANAPSRDVTLVFPQSAAGLSFGMLLVHINERGWRLRTDALAVEPSMWPSEVAPELRFRNRVGHEYTLFDTPPYLHASIGADCQVKLDGIPLGFGLPMDVGLFKGSGATIENMGNCFASTWDGNVVPNMNRKREAILFRPASTVAYLLTCDDILPQIVLAGPLIQSKNDWTLYRVECRKKSQDGGRYGYRFAQGRYLRELGRWTWVIDSQIDVLPLRGQEVVYCVEEVGTARCEVEGVLANTPDVVIEVRRPEKPWTLTATIVVDGETMQLPIKYSYCVGPRQFSGASMSDAAGNWALAGIEGPFSEQELQEKTFFDVELCADDIAEVLTDVYARRVGDANAAVSFLAIPKTVEAARRNFVARELSLAMNYSTIVKVGRETATLAAFLRQHDLGEDFTKAIKDRARGAEGH